MALIDRHRSVMVAAERGRGAAMSNRREAGASLRAAWAAVVAGLIACLPAPAPAADPARGAAPEARALIAVMPFVPRQAGDDWELRAQAFGRHIINNLSRLPGTLVMSPDSSDQWKASGEDPVAFGRTLGASYVLVGDIAPTADRVRATVMLFDSATGAQIWSDDQQEIPAELPRVAQGWARRINVALIEAAAERSFYRHINNPTSDDYTMRGLAVLNRGNTKDAIDAARRHFEDALSIDGVNVDALTGLAHTYQRVATQAWSDKPDADLTKGLALVDQAIELDPHNAYARFVRGIILSGSRRIEAADREFEAALLVNHSFAPARAFGGYNRIFLGQAEVTVPAVNQAIAISPRDPSLSIWYFFAGAAELVLGHDAAAIQWLEKSAAANQTYSTAYVWLTAAYALTGRTADAVKSREEAKRLGRFFDLRRFRLQWAERSDNPVFRRQIARVVKALRTAGVTE
jgi:TolB-like protein